LSKIVTGIFFIILCGVFFEAGLILSDTIVTGQPPQINKLLTSQLDGISSLLGFIHHSSSKQTTVTVLNPDDVASALQSKSGLDGINLQTLSAHTNESTSNDEINITLTVMGYKTTTTGANVTNGSIIIRPNQTYSITATAIGKTGSDGVTIDVNSIIITTVRELYSNAGNTS
jgi:hypothetical protein